MDKYYYLYPHDPLTGAFDKGKQHYQERLNDYLCDIKLYAEGFHKEVRKITTDESGILESDRLYEISNKMLESYPLFLGRDNKKLYIAYLYCALAFFSLSFSRIKKWPDFESFIGSGKKPLIIQYPDRIIYNSQARLSDILECSYIKFSGDGYSFTNDKYADGLESLYHYLGGEKSLTLAHFLPSAGSDPERNISKAEQEKNEIDQMLELEAFLSGADKGELNEILGEEKQEKESDSLISENKEDLEKQYNEALEKLNKKCNYISKNLQLQFDGYQDYLTEYDYFVSTFNEKAPEDFFEKIHGILSSYLKATNQCLYADEKKYLEAMSHLYAARRIICGRED